MTICGVPSRSSLFYWTINSLVNTPGIRIDCEALQIDFRDIRARWRLQFGGPCGDEALNF